MKMGRKICILAFEVIEEVEFEKRRAKWCTWGISDVEFDEIWLPINPANGKLDYNQKGRDNSAIYLDFFSQMILWKK